MAFAFLGAASAPVTATVPQSAKVKVSQCLAATSNPPWLLCWTRRTLGSGRQHLNNYARVRTRSRTETQEARQARPAWGQSRPTTNQLINREFLCDGRDVVAALPPPPPTPRCGDSRNCSACAAAKSGPPPSKRNFVIHVAALAGARHRRLFFARRRNAWCQRASASGRGDG